MSRGEKSSFLFQRLSLRSTQYRETVTGADRVALLPCADLCESFRSFVGSPADELFFETFARNSKNDRGTINFFRFQLFFRLFFDTAPLLATS
jgi:hypothetical protein